MRRLAWLIVVTAVLLSTVAYAATYSISVSTYNVSVSYSFQQKLASLVEIQGYSISYDSSYLSKNSASRSATYLVSYLSLYIRHEPDDSWIDCSFPYRKPYLFYYDGSLTDAYISFSNETDIYGNFSSHGGIIVAIDNDVVPFDYEVKESPGLIKVGIKPSSFGGTGDYVMIKVNGSWIHPVDGSVESGTSGKIINASFSLDPNYVWVIEAVGMHHTDTGWSDPTYVYIWDSNGNLLHTYKATSHIWDNSIYGSSYFEYVNIDNYQVPKEAISGSPNLYIYINLTNISVGYHYLYIYYGGVDTSYRSTGIVSDSVFQYEAEGEVQESTDYCIVSATTTQTTTTSTSSFYNWYGGGGGAPVPSSESSSSEESNEYVPPPVTETVTEEKRSWLISFIKSDSGLFLILLIILGLMLMFSSGGKGRKGRRRRR